MAESFRQTLGHTIVTSLFFLYMTRGGLVEGAFRRTHRQLKETRYIAYYEEQVGGTMFAFPKRLIAPLAIDKMIGADLREEGDNFRVSLYDVVLAKDYVASLTDPRAHAAYTEFFR